jgi:hypothetical protein
MPTLPVKQKTWTFDVNRQVVLTNTLAGKADNSKTILLEIKNILKSMGFTVQSSSDTITAAADMDLWDDITDIGFFGGSNAHSWVVLKAPGSSFEVCIDCSNTTIGIPYIYGSYGGYSKQGLLVTHRPTPLADETVCPAICNLRYFLPYINVHSMYASGNYRIFLTKGNPVTNLAATTGIFFIELDFAEPIQVSWQSRAVFCAYSSEVQESNIADNLINSNNLFKYAKFGACIGGSAYLTSLVVRSLSVLEDSFSVLLNRSNPFGNGYPIFPVGFFVEGESFKGRLGTACDLWWGTAASYTGDTYPQTGSNLYQFVQVRDLILPWNETLPSVY